MLQRIGEAREPHQLGTRERQRESQLPALLEVALDGSLHGVARVHVALPGQGMATVARRPMSTLA